MDEETWMESLGSREFRHALLAWFSANARELPWRGISDPYAVWISEIMLQQTQVATVVPYYQRFLERFPTVVSLAEAAEVEVLRLWEGLGYYRRARQLHRAAQVIRDEHGSCFPTVMDQVRNLPGIGRYTAGAILSIALDQRQPILEANTIRVFSRLVAYAGDVTKTAGQKLLWAVAENILPARRAGDFNQALMELGSELCRPTSPACSKCPVRTFCQAHATGKQESIPFISKRTQYEDLTEAAIVVRRRGKLLVRQCGPDERWTGLWDFPRFALKSKRGRRLTDEISTKVKRQTGVTVEPGKRIKTLKHGVTRYRITLHCYESECIGGRLKQSETATRWIHPRELDDLPLSVTGRKLARLITQS